jgi:hypothetical protein
MRVRTLAVVVAAIAALGLAGCGGDSSVGDPVPKSTPDLTVPPGAEVLAGGATGTDTTSTTSTSTTSTTDTTGTTTAPSAGAGGTTTATPAAPAAPTQTQAPSGGTGAGAGSGGGTGGGGTGGGTSGGTGGGTGGTGDFNEFCQQNPGACPGN